MLPSSVQYWCRGDAVQRSQTPTALESVQVQVCNVLAQRAGNRLHNIAAPFGTRPDRVADFMRQDAYRFGGHLQRAGQVVGLERVAVEQEVVTLGDQCRQLFRGRGRVAFADDEFRQALGGYGPDTSARCLGHSAASVAGRGA